MKTTFNNNKAYIFEEKIVETKVPVTTYVTVPVTTYVTKTEHQEKQVDCVSFDSIPSIIGSVWEMKSCLSTYQVALFFSDSKVHFVCLDRHCMFTHFTNPVRMDEVSQTLKSHNSKFIGRVGLFYFKEIK